MLEVAMRGNAYRKALPVFQSHLRMASPFKTRLHKNQSYKSEFIWRHRNIIGQRKTIITSQPWESSNLFTRSCGMAEYLFSILLPLSHRRNVANLSQFYCYSHGKFSVELTSLVPSVQTFTARTHHATPTESNHPQFLRKTKLKSKFH